jgi:hypothetical protein
MSLTLGVLASVLALLPGLALIAAFNFRTRRGGARRPEMQLTAIPALVLAVFLSLMTHGVAFEVANWTLAFAAAVNAATGYDLGPLIGNPLVAGLHGLEGKAIPDGEAVGLVVVLFIEVAAAANLAFSRQFQFMLERVDLNGQGWVFEHITRPAENGYTPIGHVYTSTMNGRFGIAYKGAVTDLRQDEKGQVLAIALSRPERFLYEIAPAAASIEAPRRGWIQRSSPPQTDMETGIRHHGKEPAGGVVSLDARVINNIVVHCIADSLLREIDNTLPDPPVDERA